MSSKERKLLRAKITRTMTEIVNMRSKEDDYITSSQILTARQSANLNIAHNLRRKENIKHKSSLPIAVDKTALPHINLGKSKRLFDYINDMVEDKEEIQKLHKVHGFRIATPFYTNPNLTVETGKVMNYSQHFGALLHTPRYVEFIKEMYESIDENQSNKKNGKSKSSKRQSVNSSQNSKKLFKASRSTSASSTFRGSNIDVERSTGNTSRSSVNSSKTTSVSSSNESCNSETQSRSKSSNLSLSSSSSKTTTSKKSFEKSESNAENDSESSKSSLSSKQSQKDKKSDISIKGNDERNPRKNNNKSNSQTNSNQSKKSSISKSSKENNKNNSEKVIISKNAQNSSSSNNESDSTLKDKKKRKSLSTFASCEERSNKSGSRSNSMQSKSNKSSSDTDNELSDLENDAVLNQDQTNYNKNPRSKAENDEVDTKPRDNFFDNESVEKSDVSVHDADLYEDMELYLNENNLSLDTLKMLNRYFEAFIKYRIKMSDYVKNYGEYLEKNNDEKFIKFRKIIQHYDDKFFSDSYLSSCQMLIMVEIKEAEEENTKKDEKEKSEEESNANMLITVKRVFNVNDNDLKAIVQIDEDPKQDDIESKNEAENESDDNDDDGIKDDDDDFYESFHRLYRNSIVKMSDKDKEELRKLIQQFENQDQGSSTDDRYNDDEFADKFRDMFKKSIFQLNDEDLVMIQQIFDEDRNPDPNQLENETIKSFHELIQQSDTNDKQKARGMVETQLRQRRSSNIAPVRSMRPDETDDNEVDDDFAESFQRLFRNSIGLLSDADLQNIQQLIANQEQQEMEQDNDHEVIRPFRELIQNQDNNISEQHSNEILELIGTQINLRKMSKTADNVPPDIEETEDNEIMNAFRNLFRTSVDGLTADDFNKLNKLIDKN